MTTHELTQPPTPAAKIEACIARIDREQQILRHRYECLTRRMKALACARDEARWMLAEVERDRAW